MNFADELINWRNSDPSIVKCETSINNLIQFKLEEIVDKLRNETESRKISVIKFNKKDFASNIQLTTRIKYNKVITSELIYELLLSNLEKHENIIIIQEPLNKDFLLIFYYSPIFLSYTNAEKKNAILELIEFWFVTLILPDFKKQYINWHTSNITFCSDYNAKYSYTPLIKVANRISSVSREEIRFKIIELAKSNGLEYQDIHKNYSFVLHIL